MVWAISSSVSDRSDFFRAIKFLHFRAQVQSPVPVTCTLQYYRYVVHSLTIKGLRHLHFDAFVLVQIEQPFQSLFLTLFPTLIHTGSTTGTSCKIFISTLSYLYKSNLRSSQSRSRTIRWKSSKARCLQRSL